MTKEKLKGYEVYWQDDSVYFEHDEYGEDAGIKLWFNANKEIYDYEGQYDIPTRVLSFMKELGYRSV
jgi:hypothetical protein